MNAEHGLILTKSTDEHKVPGKNWSIKRKLGEFKPEFIKFRHGNASRIELNKCCDKNGIRDQKVDTAEVEMSKKVEPNIGFLQVWCYCNISIYVAYC